VTVTSSPSAPRSEEEQGIPPLSYADAVKRLFAEFAHRYSLSDIADTVTECRAQLSGAPAPALPEVPAAAPVMTRMRTESGQCGRRGRGGRQWRGRCRCRYR
jgi:hypothetical protein